MGFATGCAFLAPSLQAEMHKPGEESTQWIIRIIQMICSTSGFFIQCMFIPKEKELMSKRLYILALFWYGVCGLAGLLMICGHTGSLL